jgi:RNA:NAD 2'-phosphotransferase (TPT1/KptA family)
MEACWNILKPRVRKRGWKDLDELKKIIQEEWKRITIEEVRASIAEMPERCKLLVKTGGQAIRSELW